MATKNFGQAGRAFWAKREGQPTMLENFQELFNMPAALKAREFFSSLVRQRFSSRPSNTSKG